MEKRLYKDPQHKMIGGVCAGLAEYFNIDVTLVRVLFFVTLVLHGAGVGLYIILWVFMPKKPFVFGTPEVDYRVPPNPFGATPQQPFAPLDAPKPRSNAGIILGAILICVGGLCLADQFDIIPDFDFDNLWPLVLVAVGCILIFTRGKKKPWEHDNWTNPTQPEQPTDTTTTEVKNDDTNTNENHPIA